MQSTPRAKTAMFAAGTLPQKIYDARRQADAKTLVAKEVEKQRRGSSARAEGEARLAGRSIEPFEGGIVVVETDAIPSNLVSAVVHRGRFAICRVEEASNAEVLTVVLLRDAATGVRKLDPDGPVLTIGREHVHAVLPRKCFKWSALQVTVSPQAWVVCGRASSKLPRKRSAIEQGSDSNTGPAAAVMKMPRALGLRPSK
jgi:hypothetical protein